MEKEAKKRLLSLLDTGHRHESMSGMLQCDYCGDKFKKAEKEYNRMRHEYPELFIRKEPEFVPPPELREQFGQLVDRIKKDKLYKRHVERLAHGTEEEKDEEIKKSNEGYYRTHYEEGGLVKEVKKMQQIK